MMMCTFVFPIFLLSSTTLFAITQAKTICEDASAGPQHSILTVGKLHGKLIVVTEPDKEDKYTQYIYEMPTSSLNNSADELFLNEDPKTVKDLWPELYKSQSYAGVAFTGLIYNSFTAIDSQSEYYFLTSSDLSKASGVVYDIKNAKAYKGLSKLHSKNLKEVLISSDKLSSFYAVQIGENKGLTIMRFKFTAATVMESIQMNEGIVPDEKGDYYPLCQVGEDQMMMEKKSALGEADKNQSSTCKPLKYPLSKGFVLGQKIYLFGEKNIYIFSSEFYDHPNKPVKVITKEYSSFINCKPEVVVKTDKSGLGIGIIIAIIIVVLIIILCCALFCTREVIHHKRRQEHRRKKKKHQKKMKEAAKAAKAAGKEVPVVPEPEKEEKTPPAGPMGSILSFFMPTPRSDEGGYSGGGKLSKANTASTMSVYNGNQASVRSSLSGVDSKAKKLSKAKSSVGGKESKLPSNMDTSAVSGGGKAGGSKAGGSKAGGSKAGGGSNAQSKAYSSSLAAGGSSAAGKGGGAKKGDDKKKKKKHKGKK